MRVRRLAALGCLLVLGCDDLDAERAPHCLDGVGCPPGTRCVDQVRCEPLPGQEPPRDPPRFGVGNGGAPAPGSAGGPRAQRDGGPTCGGGLVECAGQCVDPRSDPRHCGGCGRACAPGVDCRLGTCCELGRDVCGDRCVDLTSDPDNCGVCDFRCIDGLQCVLGLCQPPSAPIGPSTDPNNPAFPDPPTPTPNPGI